MADYLSVFLANLDKYISKFSQTMVDYLSALLAISYKYISKFSPTMVDFLSGFVAVYEVNFKFFYPWKKCNIPGNPWKS